MGAVRPPTWLDELDLHAGPPEAAMGTRGLDPARWFLVDDEWAAQRAMAASMVSRRRADVVAGSAGEAAAVLEREVATWLGVDVGIDDAGSDDSDPLVRARLHVADDLCLLTPSGRADGWVLAAGCVCFPSYWRLTDKIGRPLSFVHAPVPGYPGALAARVDAFLSRLRADGRGVWRRNWSIHRTDALFVPTHEPGGAMPAVEDRWLRSEYQTLRRLPDVDAIVFTIRTQQVRLAALADRADIRHAMAAAVRGWTPAQRAYKGGAVDDALLAWLER